MTETKMISEREAVLRERKAFVTGVCRWPDATSKTPIVRIREDAAKMYPLPTTTRPRVVLDPTCYKYVFRVRGDAIEYNGSAFDATDTWRFGRQRQLFSDS